MPLSELLTILPWKNSRLRKLKKKTSEGDEEEQVQLSEGVQVRAGRSLSQDAPVAENEEEEAERDMLNNFIDVELGGSRTTSLFVTFQQMNSRRTQNTHPMAETFMKCLDQGNMKDFDVALRQLPRDELNQVRIAGQPLLHLVCLKEDMEALKMLLATGIDVNPESDDGTIPLHIAVLMEWTEGVRELLKHGADKHKIPTLIVPSPGIPREAPILTAARNGDYKTAFLLMSNENSEDVFHPLRQISERNESLIVSEDEGDEESSSYQLWTLKDHWGNTVLHLAALSHCVPLLRRLLEMPEIKVIINSKNDGRGDTPLHLLIRGPDAKLCQDECVDCVGILLKSGSDVNLPNTRDGETPLYLAARNDLPKIVQKLLESGADPTYINAHQRSAVHAACLGASQESLLHLVRSGISSDIITKEDEAGLSPFHLAAGKCSIECCQILLQNGESLATKDCEKNSRCMVAFNNMTSAGHLMKKVLDSKVTVSDHDRYSKDFNVTIDFDIILSKDDAVQNSIISDLTYSDLEPLLNHPVLDAFLSLKWHKIRFFFYPYVLLYCLFLIAHTVYIVMTFGMIPQMMSTQWTEAQMKIFHHIHMAMLIILLLPDIVIVLSDVKKYLKHWETWFKVTALNTAYFVVLVHSISSPITEFERIISSISIFFAWVEFSMLLGRFPILGIYIFMFTTVLISVVKVVAAFLSLLIAFALAFTVLLNSVSVFNNFPIGLVKTLMMMLGEIDYASIYKDSGAEENINTGAGKGLATAAVSQIFLVAFLFLIPILMANLLIGVAVNNLPDIERQGKILMLAKKADFLITYEKILDAMKVARGIPNIIVRKLDGFGKVKRTITAYLNKGDHEAGNTIISSDTLEEAIKIGDNIKKKEEVPTHLEELMKKVMLYQVQSQSHLHTIVKEMGNDETPAEMPKSSEKRRILSSGRRSRLDLFKS